MVLKTKITADDVCTILHIHYVFDFFIFFLQKQNLVPLDI